MNKIRSIMETRNKFQKNYNLTGVKLLIIDDDVGLANSIKYYFEDMNCEVFVSYSGEGGIQMVLKEKPDIVIVDLNMPGMSGLEVITFLSKHHADTPTVVVSGTGIIKEAIKSIKIGAWDFVTKPIMNFEELEMSVLKALEKAQLIMENTNYKENLELLVKERTEQVEHKSRQLELMVKELQATKEKLIAADRLKSEFLAQISHEIRTPINILIGYSEILRMEFEDKLSDNFEQSYTVVTKASKRIIRTIELILQMSELVSGTYTLANEDIDLNELVEEIVNTHFREAEEKGISLELSKVDAEIIYSTDRTSLETILNQIIGNAIKFTEYGKVEITLLPRDKNICIEIKDTGIGISKEYIPKLFEPFSQEDQGYSRSFDGNGLGLALVKKYCELNEIEIQVESTKGAGSLFRLVLNN
jgi:two-component system, sensor histidine kinase